MYEIKEIARKFIGEPYDLKDDSEGNYTAIINNENYNIVVSEYRKEEKNFLDVTFYKEISADEDKFIIEVIDYTNGHYEVFTKDLNHK